MARSVSVLFTSVPQAVAWGTTNIRTDPFKIQT